MAAGTIDDNCGVTRNNLAPHCVSKIRKPNVNEAAAGKQPSQPIARTGGVGCLCPNRLIRVPMTTSICGWDSSTRKGLNVRKRRGQVGIPKADIVRIPEQASKNPWRTASALPLLLARCKN